MVTVSEALVMRALASDEPSSAVSAQLARMSNKVEDDRRTGEEESS